MTSIVVDTAALRAALQALRGHVPSGKDDPYAWIRCEVTGPVLQLAATTLVTAAIAIVSVVENEDGEAGIFDLYPSEVAELLLAFRTKNGAGDDEIGPALRIDTPATYAVLRFTDISGLWPGKSISFPRATAGGGTPGEFPEVPDMFARVLARPSTSPDRIVTNGPALAVFAKAAAAYGQPLLIESVTDSGRTLLVSCGESFLGLLATSELDEDRQVQVLAWREAWARRLPPAKAARS